MMISTRTKINQVCIVALDALEYDLIEKFNLDSIRQIEYGKIDISDFKELSTPIIWASFITGLPPEKHGVKLIRWNNPILQRLHRLSFKLKMDKIKGKGKIFQRLGFERRPFTRETREEFKKTHLKTLFDVIPNAYSLSVPPYQEWTTRETSLLMKKVLDGKEKMKKYEEHVLNVFREKRKKLFETLKQKPWNLFMAHFMFTDLLAHFYISDSAKMLSIYTQAEKLVNDIKKSISEEVLLLIVSDHGMKIAHDGKYGVHSNHGFYSSNIRLNLSEPKITDFFPLITNFFQK